LIFAEYAPEARAVIDSTPREARSFSFVALGGAAKRITTGATPSVSKRSLSTYASGVFPVRARKRNRPRTSESIVACAFGTLPVGAVCADAPDWANRSERTTSARVRTRIEPVSVARATN
jgi:hypothetical protein